MPLSLPEKLQLAAATARVAGEILRARRPSRVEHKAQNDYVTDLDREVERCIRAALLSTCPEDSFLGEESGATDLRPGQWIVDPIDGTTNFIRNLAPYTVSIAYRLRGELVLGCVYAPALNEMFLAQKGCGATLNGLPICVSQTKDPAQALAAISFSHRHPLDRRRMLPLICALTDELNDMRRLGSAAYDLCLVASGRLDAYLELRLNIYDIAAGIVILQEAGGIATGWPDEPDCTETGNIFATNALLHPFFTRQIRTINDI